MRPLPAQCGRNWQDDQGGALPILDHHEPSNGTRPSVISDVREALLGLGYIESEIREVLRDVSVQDGAESLLRDALQALGARRAG